MIMEMKSILFHVSLQERNKEFRRSKPRFNAFFSKTANGLHAKRQNVYEKNNKTDCVGFMLQNRDN
jgi:hypothetical protein